MPYQRERNATPGNGRMAKENSVRFAIRLAYDGTDYQGFQSQPHGNTIQDQLEYRLSHLLKRKIRIFGWGRTDTGVHASGAVVTVDLTLAEIERLSGAKKQKQNSDVTLITAILLHSALKEFSCNTGEGRGGFYGSITAKSVAPVSADFDARFSCKWKRYVYYVCTGYNRSPFLARYAWEINHRLDLGKMKEAATFLNGRHNFDWMSVTEEGELRDVFREFELSIEKIQMDNGFSLLGGDNDRQVFKIIGVCDFFLYKMMRRIVGILVAIGRRQVDPSVLKNHLVLRDDIVPSEESSSMPTIPTALSHTAPSKGLCLEHVEYDVPI